MKLSFKIAILVFAGTTLTVIWSGFIIPKILYNYSPYFQEYNQFAVQIFLTIVSVVAPVSAVVFMLLNRIVIKPIVDFSQATKVIASGNLGPRLLVATQDELGDLARNLNMMTKNMADAFQGISNSLKETIQQKAILASSVRQLEAAKQVSMNTLADLNTEKEELSKAKAKDDALLESIGDGIIVADSQERITYLNKEAENITGFRTEEVVPRNYSEILPSFRDDSGTIYPIVEQPIKRALVSGVRVLENCYYKRKSGLFFYAAVVASPVVSSGGINGVIVAIRDITKERDIDRMKTEFISLASHQLRTPLSAIRWFTELLLDESSGKLNPEQKELAINVNASAERMVALVNSLLNISRIESGRIIVDPESTDLVELVKEVVGELQVKLREKGHKLIVSANPQLPRINIDPKLIRQVYMNLLTNSIKYTPNNGEIVVFISRRGEDVISQVSDNGYGIPKAQHAKVFQKFFRAENIIKIETDGNGLGMYLVKSIIESSNGKIWFESEEGKGTTFWFSLPMVGMAAKKGEVTLDS